MWYVKLWIKERMECYDYMNIKADDERINKIKNVEIQIKNQHGKIYIWGCSQTARMVAKFCCEHTNLNIEAYVVDDTYYQEDFFEGKQVYKASEWMKFANAGDFVIFGFTNSKVAKKLKQTLPKGVEGIYFCFPYSNNVNGEYLTYQKFKDNQSRFEKTYELLKDDFSRQVMEAFINACISGNIEQIEKLETEDQYFNELTKSIQDGCFVDLGAYIGDTIEGAYHFYGERLRKVVAFEPDPYNIEVLKQRVRKCGIEDSKIQLITKGSWSKQETLYFSTSNSSSSISDTGDIEIEVDSLDNILENNVMPVSYIKMDVEGSEMESLLGAKDTIKKNHPILAVCVYHKPEDLYNITELIQELAGKKQYDYYLRYHGTDLRELVLYVIPTK